mmetsp:Transcript_8140/g.11627  ORF Transcript_8140/g.11627 Transcript_8140/m.11627 type:complete len:713 (-) Transcript_8140:34-2172(-)
MPSQPKPASLKSNLPTCTILFRSKESVEVHSIEKNGDKNGVKLLVKGLSTMHSFPPDGSKVLLYMPSVGVIARNLGPDAVSGNTIDMNDIECPKPFLENSKGVQFMTFSTRGTYILTWERPIKVEEKDGLNSTRANLKIWCAETGKYLYGFNMRVMKRDQWPPIKWTHDESKAFHMVTNEIRVYDGHIFIKGNGGEESDSVTSQEVRFEGKIRCEGIRSFTLPTSHSDSNDATLAARLKGKYFLSTFVPETKGKPARIQLMRYPDLTDVPVASKSFYQAEECSVRWSPKGDSALVLTHTTVDSSGASYYGSTNLYLMLSQTTRGRMDEGAAISVPLPVSNGNSSATGPVMDVSWMPDPIKPPVFAVISGRMPALSSLHNGITAEPTFLFGNAHRNTIVWSKQGRFLTLAGFGNLAGGMDFIDRNKLKPMSQIDPRTGLDLGTRGNTASCAVGYGWSPDGRYFAVSTTSPRMNVDNGVKLYKYNGLEIAPNSYSWDNEKYKPDKLLAAEFVPALHGTYPDRPQTPPPKRSNTGIGAGNGESKSSNAGKEIAKETTSSSAYVPPAGRYIPPGARRMGGGNGGGTSLADRMRKEREGNNVGFTKINTLKTPKQGHVPGSTAEQKSKNSIRREKQRLAKQRAEEAAKQEAERKAQEEKDRIAANIADPEKRVKKISKILKQIEDLKLKEASALNDDQKRKIATESDLRNELASIKI